MQVDQSTWDRFIQDFPAAHILQSSAWSAVKAQTGWFPVRIVDGGTGTQVLFRKLPGGISIGYLPKGPLGIPTDRLWQEVVNTCKKNHAVFLKVEPDLWESEKSHTIQWLEKHGRISQPVQPWQTITLDLQGGEESVMARMKQKTRYNIHLAEKKEIIVQPWDDVVSFGKMMQVTSERDGFGVHSTEYYRQVYEQFIPSGQGRLLVAAFQGTPLAAVFIMRIGERAWYFYGASTNEERNRMPTYLLQWEAIRWAIQSGCKEYDLWGIPDVPEQQLEEQFADRSEGLWGVYRFKRGFGGQVRRSIGAWDLVYYPVLYRLYQWMISRRRSNYAD